LKHTIKSISEAQLTYIYWLLHSSVILLWWTNLLVFVFVLIIAYLSIINLTRRPPSKRLIFNRVDYFNTFKFNDR
jgi:hypothetical protein